MAALILVLAGAVVWLEVDAMKRFGRAALQETQYAREPRPGDRIEEVVAATADEIAMLLDLHACWFEPFPFDALLPRIEEGRIILPTPEPGVAPCSDFGVELPVRLNDLTLGRFVLQPHAPTVGVVFAPSARNRAIAIAGRLSEPIAAALINGDASPRRGPSAQTRENR